MKLDWHAMFAPSMPWLEIVLRGSLMYLALLGLLRGVLKRIEGTLGLADLLMVVMIADAAQNGMAANYKSVTDGIVLVATLVFWNYALDRLGYHIPFVERLLHPPALLLVKDGQIQWRNMRREFITQSELMSEVRSQGLADLSQVKSAHMEGDGRISIIPRETAPVRESAPIREAAHGSASSSAGLQTEAAESG